MADTIHFRCTFDVEPTGGEGFVTIVQEIVTWIRTKERTALDLRVPRLLGESSAHRPDGRAQVTTDALSEADASDVWALRYEHQDAEFSARRWTIDLATSRINANRWRLATTVGNSLHPTYIGKEPGRLPVTPPRVIKNFVSSTRFRCFAGTLRVGLEAIPIAVGKADRLVKMIEDPGRACPVVYVSACRNDGQPLVDPARLAATIAGVGIVCVSSDPDLDEELEFLMPRELRAPNGMVRVYAPGARLDAPQQAHRHRYFTRSQIAELTAQEVEAQIAHALARRQGWANVRSSVESIADVASRRREVRRASLQRQTDAASQKELLSLYESENEQLTKQVANLQRKKGEMEELVDERDGQIDQLQDDVKEARYQADFYRKEAERVARELSTAQDAAGSLKMLRRLPNSLSDVVSLVEQLHGDLLVFTEEAKKSAREATLDDPSVAWECLTAIATELPSIAFGDRKADMAAEFRSRTSFELSLTESRMTKKDSALLGLRKVVCDGREWDMSAHVKYGVKPPKCLRVHFAIDRDAKRILIGHCGDHLETAGTRRMN